MREYNEALRFLERLDILPFTLRTSRIASELELDLKEKGQSVNLIDILIAATAIEHNAKLVTRDEGYRNIPGLEVAFYQVRGQTKPFIMWGAAPRLSKPL